MNDELCRLADGYLEGNLGEEETLRLQNWLQSDPDIKRQFVAHLVLHGQLGVIAEELRTVHVKAAQEDSPLDIAFQRKKDWSRSIRIASAVAIAASVFAIVFSLYPTGRALHVQSETDYESASIPIRTVGFYLPDGSSSRARPVAAGSNASSKESAIFSTASRAKVQLAPGTLFGFADDAFGLLYRGSVDVSIDDPADHYAIEVGNRRIISHGAPFTLTTLDAERTQLTVHDGSVDIQTRLLQPRLYWPFDGHRDSLPIVPFGQALRVPGMIGSGAVQVDGKRGSRFEIVGGTGDTVSSGAFAFSGAITIECVISSTWDGSKNNQDPIFRKEDGPNRILLGFQNDDNDFEIPTIPEGPVLSFGIFLQSSGYSELDMPLDGEEGRPTVAQIADGKPHHIAATYDSFTGVKSIAVDGLVLYSYRFPVGQCIQSGGPRAASIGGWRNRESFSGTIDELAFYDYALTAEQIAMHAQLAAKGIRWIQPRASSESGWVTSRTVTHGEVIVLRDSTTSHVTHIQRTERGAYNLVSTSHNPLLDPVSRGTFAAFGPNPRRSITDYNAARYEPFLTNGTTSRCLRTPESDCQHTDVPTTVALSETSAI